MTKVDCLHDGAHELGEGPVWNEADGRLWWVDIRAPALHAIEPRTGAHQHWPMPAPLGSFAFRASGGLLLALGTELVHFTPAEGTYDRLATLEPVDGGTRLNDGKTDRQGRFWVGTMKEQSREPKGTLYRYISGGEASPVRRDVAIPNSLAFSPDGRTMYFADTMEGRILAFDYDRDTGEATGERTFATLESAPGRPDGSTVDEDGCLWNARYGGSCVVRYTPAGAVDRIVQLPASQVTSCAFGGPGLESLFITTAAQNLTGKAKQAEPLAGGLFVVQPGVRGILETAFAG